MDFLTSAPIDASELARSVGSPRHGAVTTFIGHVRDHQDGRAVTRLDYSAYAPMAEHECARIVDEAGSKWPVAVSLSHRTGSLVVGDVAIAVAVASAHRDAAFTACRYVVEEVKRRVPIWKHEWFADGTDQWVDPTGAQGLAPDTTDQRFV